MLRLQQYEAGLITKAELEQYLLIEGPPPAKDTGPAEALARYLGEDFEVHVRQSGIVGVRRKPLTTAPDWGITKVDLDTTYRATMWYKHFQGIPQGQPVPY